MPASRQQLGLSLVELMVALAIGTFLLAGTISVFGKTRDLYRTNEASARLQETARYAMGTIEADLRMANYWGLMSRADLIENGPALDLANLPAVDPTYSLPAELTGYAGTINQCGAMWAVKLPAYIEATDSYTLGCAANSDTRGRRLGHADDPPRVDPGHRDPARRSRASAGQIKLQTSRVQGTLFASATLPAGYLPPLSETRALVVNGYYVGPGLRRARRHAVAAPQAARRRGRRADDHRPADRAGRRGPAGRARRGFQRRPERRLFRAAEHRHSRRRPDRRGPHVAAGPRGAAGDGLHRRAHLHYGSRIGANVYTPGDAFRRVLVTKTIALRNTRR